MERCRCSAKPGKGPVRASPDDGLSKAAGRAWRCGVGWPMIPGARPWATFRYTVAGADTAAAVGSGEVTVLATPRMFALAKWAAVAAVAGELAASPVGPTWRSPRSVSGSPADACSSPVA